MRERWYGDRRDLVKWSCLLDLATKNQLRRIVYVVCLRADTTERDTLTQTFGSEITRAVWNHFRDLDSSGALAEQLGIQCDIVDQLFPASGDARRLYWDAVSEAVSEGPRPSLVFVDPDTGLGSSTSGTHVGADELQLVWGLLEAGECLVFYQHAWRVQDWRNQARRRFAAALDVPEGQVGCIHSEVSKDVVFLVSQKIEAMQ
jgi:hypothetical protein